MDLVLKARLLGQHHAELGELKKHLEVREEVDHLFNGTGITNFLEEIAFTIAGLVNFLGNTLEPYTIEIDRSAILNLEGVRLG